MVKCLPGMQETLDWIWGYMPVIPAFGRWREARGSEVQGYLLLSSEFKASLAYIKGAPGSGARGLGGEKQI